MKIPRWNKQNLSANMTYSIEGLFQDFSQGEGWGGWNDV